MPDAMTTRERLCALLAGEPVDRLPLVEWATWWDRTLDTWRAQGLPADLDRYGLYRHFGLDDWRQCWVGPAVPPAPAHGAGVIADADAYAALRPELYPDEPMTRGGVPAVDVLAAWSEAHARGEVAVWFTVPGFFWYPRTLLGIERHLYAFYDHPELMQRINADLADWMLAALDRMCAVLTPEFVTFAEDLSYNHGPMLSEAHFDEFLLPCYRRVIPALRERGIVPIIDSDGDITTAVPWFERAGLRGVLPLERQAGIDVAAIRARHPDLVMIGAFDKMCMTRGEAALRAEFERLLPVARTGRFAISVDHQTPPAVSLDDYRLYLRLLREYAARV